MDMDYVNSMLVPLRNDHGVACFAASRGGADVVLFCDHVFSERAAEFAHSRSSKIRAAHAIAIQREARVRAADAGYEALIA